MVRSGRALARSSRRPRGLKEKDVRINIAQGSAAGFGGCAASSSRRWTRCSPTPTIYGKSDQPIEVSAARDDSSLVFSVADHGAGLAPGEENKVFEKFYRGPGTRPGGLGLGLSIARQLVEAHGGQIVAQNREDGGARFSIRLPIGEADAACRPKRPHETGRADH